MQISSIFTIKIFKDNFYMCPTNTKCVDNIELSSLNSAQLHCPFSYSGSNLCYYTILYFKSDPQDKRIPSYLRLENYYWLNIDNCGAVCSYIMHFRLYEHSPRSISRKSSSNYNNWLVFFSDTLLYISLQRRYIFVMRTPS
jgi:hypothetical protein